MGKKRKQGTGRPKPKMDSDEELERMGDPDPKSRSFMFDEIDEFHENKQKMLLEPAKKYQSRHVESDEEEVYGLDLSSEEDDVEEKFQQFQVNLQKDQMDSDLENDNDRLLDDKAWGRFKPAYYDTDYVDKGHRDKTKDENELAEAEEKEAKALQQRLAEQLDDQDYDLDLFTVAKKAPEAKEDKEQVVEKDLSKLSKQEKIEIVKRESPELLVLLEDLKKMINETKERLLPLMSLIERGVIADGSGATYLKTKYHLLINYFTNACFYVMLKVKRTPLTNHPIIARLVSYRKMIQELYTLDELLQEEVDSILKCVNRSGDVERVLLAIGRKGQPQESTKKQLGILRKNPSLAEVETPRMKLKENRVSFAAEKKRKRTSARLTDDTDSAMAEEPAVDEDRVNAERRLLPKKAKLLESVERRTQAQLAQKEKWKPSAEEFKAFGDEIHQARMRAGEMWKAASAGDSAEILPPRILAVEKPKAASADVSVKITQEQNTELAAEESVLLEETNASKRPINFQIAKNKGLTPYRKKEDGNPRVKYRKKFVKAVSRRKGQVRDVKREDKRYGGESAGIRATASRSIKFK